MAIGFKDQSDFSPIIGWELYQVTIDKYHVMFWFENGYALLNVAHSFSFKSSGGDVAYTYEIYGTRKHMNFDCILRERIVDIRIAASDRLDLIFGTRDILTIHDNMPILVVPLWR